MSETLLELLLYPAVKLTEIELQIASDKVDSSQKIPLYKRLAESLEKVNEED